MIIPDGAADHPLHELGGRTPLRAAETPNMDKASRNGLLGLVSTVPSRMEPGSDVAIMNLLGYDPLNYYTGRAPLEAADMDIILEEGEWALRCNLTTVKKNRLEDFSAGHISTKEAKKLLKALNEQLGADHNIEFRTGTGYRHLLLCGTHPHWDFSTNPPHQVTGRPLPDIFPTGEGAKDLIEIMKESRTVLENHKVNKKRVKRGLSPANMIWLWGQGHAPSFEPFIDKFGVKGAVISAVNLVRGIGKLVGWDIINVPNITGYLDTDYEAKGTYAIKNFNSYDIVTVHIEAPDEASHEGDWKAKTDAIEKIDAQIVGPIMEYREQHEDFRLLIVPDHLTSTKSRHHERGKVPAAIWGAGIKAASGLAFSEAKAQDTDIVWDNGHELMPSFLK